MNDPIRANFLARQFEKSQEIARSSDVLDLMPCGQHPETTDRYVATFQCRSAFRDASGGGVVVQPMPCLVGIWFSDQYLRRVDSSRLVIWIGPSNIVHPNILPPGICLGPITPGMELLDLVYHMYEIITYAKWAAHDYLNVVGAEWARRNQSQFPLDTRPLLRRRLDIDVTPQTPQES